MALDDNYQEGNQFDSGAVALVRELKLSLHTIALQAEVESSNIRLLAMQSMRLIDSYIASSSSAHGQQSLVLSPLAIGSVMHTAVDQLRETSGLRIEMEAKAHVPVMTNARALANLLETTGNAMADITSDKLLFRSFVTSKGDVGVGVFAKNIDISSVELRSAISSVGNAQMPLARHSERSGVMLLIADSLAKALGGALEVKRMGKWCGFTTVLPRSEQLALM